MTTAGEEPRVVGQVVFWPVVWHSSPSMDSAANLAIRRHARYGTPGTCLPRVCQFNVQRLCRRAQRIQRRVFPRIAEHCRRLGGQFQAIDLRWGVGDEAARRNQQTINLCLTELRRCQELSPRPNFVLLLGERYGWRPPPPQIEAAEFEALQQRIDAHGLALS